MGLCIQIFPKNLKKICPLPVCHGSSVAEYWILEHKYWNAINSQNFVNKKKKTDFPQTQIYSSILDKNEKSVSFGKQQKFIFYKFIITLRCREGLVYIIIT